MVAIPIPTVMTTTILELPGTNYRLRKVLVAEIEHDPAGFVMSEQSTGVFYYDRDFSKVLAGFVQAFVDHYEFLQNNKDNLSPSLQAELEHFEALLDPQSSAT